MKAPPSQESLRDRFFTAMLEATFPLKTGPDQEAVLQALIQATDMLRDHLEHELEELRLEQAE